MPPKVLAAIALALGLGLVAGLAGMGAAIAGSGKQVLPFGEVNWDKGHIKVSAIGLPPFGGHGSVSAQDVARQNAASLAQKRLLGVVLDLGVRGRKVRDVVAERPELKERLVQLVASAGVAGKSYSDGSVEITLTLPTDQVKGLLAGI